MTQLEDDLQEAKTAMQELETFNQYSEPENN